MTMTVTAGYEFDVESVGSVEAVEAVEASEPDTAPETAWVPICKFADLEPGRGVAALVEGEQVAVFRLRDDALHAVGNIDPFSGAAVMSRGITGMRADGTVTVASPMYKDVFDLATGVALEAPEVVLPVRSVRRHRGLVWVAAEVGAVAA